MKNKKIYLLIGIVGFISLIFGVTYAFFNYSRVGSTSELVTGEVYFNFTNESNGIVLTNAFPESVSTARSRTDNIFTFDIVGRNTYNKPIYYEIDLVNGEVPSGKEESNRINPDCLRFDLMEGENIIIENVNFDNLNSRKIYVDTIDESTTSNITRSYTLRMWIDEDLMISDTNSGADYTAEEYSNLFASVKVRVIGDFDEKEVYFPVPMKRELPSSYKFWPSEITAVYRNINTLNFVQMDMDEIDDRYGEATIKKDITGTNDTINPIAPVKVWLEDDVEEGKYVMYVASPERIVFPSDSSYMISSVYSIPSINFDNVDTSMVTDMNHMFAGCYYLTTLDLSNFNTKRVTDMNNMFLMCYRLLDLNVSNFDTRNVINMEHMFHCTEKITALDLSNWNTGNVTNMFMMFDSNYALETLNISNWNTSKVTNMAGMLYNCSSLKTIYVGNDWNMTNVTNSSNMFNGCTSLVGGNGTTYDSSHIDASYAHVDEPGNPGYLTLKTS